MIYLVLGTDFLRGREKLKSLVAQFKSEKENAFSLFEIDEDNFSETGFGGFLKAETLFSSRSLIVAKRLFRNQEIARCLLDNLESLAASENIFVFFEESLPEEHFACVKNYSSKIWEFDKTETADKKTDRDKDIFRLCDSIGLRQRHRSWLLFQEAVLRGIPPEDIFRLVFWQIKTILIFKSEKGKGMKPYFYEKTKNASSFFSEEELKKMSSDLVELYHAGRYHGHQARDLAVGLEKFILRV